MKRAQSAAELDKFPENVFIFQKWDAGEVYFSEILCIFRGMMGSIKLRKCSLKYLMGRMYFVFL